MVGPEICGIEHKTGFSNMRRKGLFPSAVGGHAERLKREEVSLRTLGMGLTYGL